MIEMYNNIYPWGWRSGRKDTISDKNVFLSNTHYKKSCFSSLKSQWQKKILLNVFFTTNNHEVTTLIGYNCQAERTRQIMK